MPENYEFLEPEKPSTFQRLRDQIYFVFGTVGLFYLVEVLDVIFGQKIERLGGIYPRDFSGLLGIFSAPFLHGNWPHLMANTLPFIVLGLLVIISSTRERFIAISCIIAAIAGLGTWTFAKGGYHIGASSLIFGYLGFLLWRAWLGRNFGWTIIALLAGVLYGSIIISLFKTQANISWSGHAFGLLGGIISAFILTPKQPTIPAP